MAVRAVIITRPHPLARPFHDRFVQRHAAHAQGIEVGDHEQTVDDGYAEQRDEADGGRNAEIGPRQIESPDAANREVEHVANDHQGVRCRAGGRR
jgi:hypothetical protein